MDRIYDLVSDLIDTETLAVVFVFALACLEPAVREAVAGGFLGYVVGKSRKQS